MSKLTEKEIIKLGDTARIAITDKEAQEYSSYFEEKLNLAEDLLNVDTEGVNRTSHGINLVNVMREDVPSEGLTEEEVFKNAPAKSKTGQFRVPTILE